MSSARQLSRRGLNALDDEIDDLVLEHGIGMVVCD